MIIKKVPQKTYNSKYFLQSCDGYDLWEESFGKELSPRLAYSLKIADLKKGEKVLDFGCGRGEMVVQSAMKGCEAVGVDYSPEAIALAKKAIAKNSLKAKAQLVKGGELPFKSGSFNVVFLLDVVEHLNFQELTGSLREIKRVLKLRGRIILHTSPNMNWIDYGYKYFTRSANFIASKLIWEPFFKTKLNYQKNPRTELEKKVHINEQTPKTLKQSLKKVGFANIKIWLDSSFRMTSKGFWFQYTFLQPIWLPVLGKYFASDIWAVVYSKKAKTPTVRSEMKRYQIPAFRLSRNQQRLFLNRSQLNLSDKLFPKLITFLLCLFETVE